MNQELAYNFKIEGRDSQALYNNLVAALEYEAQNDEMFANALLWASAEIYFNRTGRATTSNCLLQSLDDGYQPENFAYWDEDTDDDEDWEDDSEDWEDYESQ